MGVCDCLPSAAGGAGAGCPRCDACQASLESGNPLVPVPLRLSSRPAARARRGPGRGALGPFANQKNRRAQNDLGGAIHGASAVQTTGAAADQTNTPS